MYREMEKKSLERDLEISSQLGAFNQIWNSPHTTGQLMAAGAGTYPLQNFSNTSPTHYPFINAHSNSPPYHITKYLPSTVHTTAAHTPFAYSQTIHQIHPTIPLSEFHTHIALLTHLTKPNIFNNFLNTWA